MKIIYIVLGLLILSFGIIIGFTIINFPIIKFNTEVKIYEVFNILLTATIGLLVPFFIKRLLEDNRLIKNNLIEELKDTLKETSKIKDKITFCYNKKSITQDDKDEINFLFTQSDIKFTCVEELLKSTYEVQTKNIVSELKNIYIAYWKYVTGGELMNSRYKKLPEEFLTGHNTAYSKFEIKIRNTINKIHKL